MKNWTTKELNEMDDLMFIMSILSECQNSLNQNELLAKKLEGARAIIEELHSICKERPGCSLQEAVYRNVQHHHLIADIGNHLEDESCTVYGLLCVYGLTSEKVLSNAALMGRIVELFHKHENAEGNFWNTLDYSITKAIKEMLRPIPRIVAIRKILPDFQRLVFAKPLCQVEQAARHTLRAKRYAKAS